MKAPRRSIFSTLPFGSRLPHQARIRQLARYAKRAQLRIETLENRYALAADLDLQALSDSGASDTDNITNETTLSVDATGLTTGSFVRIKHGDTIVGAEQEATGATLTFSIDVSALADGNITLTVEENIGGAGYVASANTLTINKDTTLDAPTTTPPAGPLVAGDAFSYDANHAEEGQGSFTYELVNVPSGESASISASTGVVSWTPTGPGDYSFGIKFTDTAGNTGTQAVNITVKPPKPTAIDLLAAYDSGIDNDNITNSNTLRFSVTGVDPDATVQLKIGNTVIGSQLANGATSLEIEITDVDQIAAFTQGQLEIVAEQQVNGITSDPSDPLTITYDTEIEAISSTAPTAATVGAQLTYDAVQAEEPNVTFSLSGTVPAGVDIVAATGVLTWTPTAGQIGAHSFNIVATDVAGNTTSQAVSLTVSAAPPPTAPGIPDLLQSSDSGSSLTDNITNAATLTFGVSGIAPTATAVNLKLNGSVIGTINPNGATTVEISVADVSQLPQGQLEIAAEQVVNGVTSDLSTALTITYDTQIAAITGTPPTTGTVNVQITYDAGSADEGSIVYSLAGGAPAGATIDASTGVLTWTPQANQTGANAIQIIATDTAGNTATQDLSITVSAAPPAAPNAPDLQAASDSGASSTDNITNAGTWVFDITGVTAGARVNLKHNGNIVAFGDATGTSISLTIVNTAQFADGDVVLTAEQVIDNVASAPSASITVTKDTVIGNLTSTAPTTATAGAAFTYNAQHPDEGTNGFVYALVNPPAGVTIDAATGVVSWTPSAATQVGTQAFGVKVTDLAGNTTTQNLTIDVARPVPALNATLKTDISIFVNGVQVNIPDELGRSSGNQIAHTFVTNADNRVFIGPINGTNPSSSVTLNDFFNTWRTNAGTPGNNPSATFSSTSLMGNNVVSGQTIVRMWVNGKPSTEFENYVIRDEDDITLSFEAVGTTNGPTLAPIQNVTVFAGAPLHIPLTAFSSLGQNLTFSAQSSNTSVVTTGISNTNRSIRITVAGFGEMTFELFEDKVGDVTDEIIALINSGHYNNTIFHRVINGFVIQGGDKDGNGENNEGLPEFDDQFHVDLQHTSAGLLSMAKIPLDDTNTSQFFITDAATRFLDFNHSVFGRLTSGDDVRELISNVAVNNSTENRPVTNVVMSKVEVFMDKERGVLMLKAPEGVTGTSNITVTVTDENGNTYNQTFAVTVAADTSNSPNSPPFLNPVQDVSTTSGTAVNIQLTSQDVENGSVFYAIDPKSQDTGSKPYTASINSATGLVTITPNAGFVGTFQVTLGVRQNPTISTINDQWDTQTITVTVTPAQPSAPDLVDASDTGVSATDNITKGGSWTFTVGNVTSGATVRLFAGNQLLGTTTASGNTATIAFDSSVLQDGQVQITAEQTVTVNNVAQTSSRSLPVTITKDTTAPAAFDFTTPVPTTAIVNQPYSYNFTNPEEGTTGFKYSLVNAPTGVAINADNGQVTWTPTNAQLGAQSFTVRFSDVAGNLVERVVNATVISNQQQLVQFYVRITDLNGNEITQIEQGEDFFVTIRIEDLRAAAEGVFAAYADMTYDQSKVTAVSPITFFSEFANVRTGSLATAGLVDEVGATAGSTGLGDGIFNLARIRFTATALGTVAFATNPADVVPEHLVLLYNVGSGIPNTQITHAAGSINVVAPTGAVADELTVTEDSQANVLNVLSNDTLPTGVTGPLSISAVTQPTAGGTVSISQDGLQLLFTPTADFTGEANFTYTITNNNGFTDTTTVRLNVSNTNDPPTANDDNLSINEDAANSTLNVLANDSFFPDPTETLTITSVTQPTTGGTVSIAADGKSLIFNPTANFNGAVTFTYTINDGTSGSDDTATVNLTINSINDNPTAAADAQTVAEDSGATTINVLTNDGFAPDTGETISVVSVTQGSQGGTITIGANGANVVYTPKANFFGTETFTYTISDGNSGTATATVTMTVTPVNDPPDAVNDTATTIKNTGPLTINVLANDTFAPDTGEVLTITAVTQPTTGGTVTIASDGKSLVYTPTANFSGTVTFTYTINDGTSGSNDTATVTVTVQDFIPSDIAGYVYIDANKDGVRDPGEIGIAGVTVNLTGTATGNQAVNVNVTTMADGSYKFINVAPGSYTITQTQPAFVVDGPESLGSFGGTKPSNDKMSFTIPQDSHLTNYNFGEYGREAKFVTMKDFLTSTPIGASYLGVTSAGSVSWMQLGPSFSNVTATSGSLNTAKTQLTLNITENGQQFTATIAMNDATKIKQLANTNGALLLHLLGTRQSLGFTAVNNNGAQGEAPVAAAAAPQGESFATTSNELPGPQPEAVSMASESSSSPPALLPQSTNSQTNSSPAATTSDTTPSDYGTSSYTASMADSYGSSDAATYEDVGSDSSALGDDQLEAHDEAIGDYVEDAYLWLDQDEEHDDENADGASEEDAVDALMSDDAW